MSPRLLVAAGSLLLACGLAGCGGSSPAAVPTAPTAPSAPGGTPAPSSRYSLSGTIVELGTQSAPANARVAIVEGANQGKTAGTDAAGRYRIDDLEPGTFSMRATADAMEPETRSVTLSADQTADFGLKRIESPPPPSPRVEGRAVDSLTDSPLGGVTIKLDGVGETTTDGNGGFTFDASDPEQIHTVTLSSSSIVTRTTRLRVPGPSATLSLIPSSFDLTAYDQMFRFPTGVLRRWTSAPRVVVLSRVLQFTNKDEEYYTALGTAMGGGEVSDLLKDLRWALPQLTGNTFTAFADEQSESAAEGDHVGVSRPGLIVVARYKGLKDATTYWGYTRWAWNGAGELQAGIVMLDSDFDASDSPYRRSLRTHEFGHALGYTHVGARTSVMNPDARTEPNAFDKDGAKIAFQRPPLNRTPDIDPDPFTGNLRALAQLFWAGDR